MPDCLIHALQETLLKDALKKVRVDVLWTFVEQKYGSSKGHTYHNKKIYEVKGLCFQRDTEIAGRLRLEPDPKNVFKENEYNGKRLVCKITVKYKKVRVVRICEYDKWETDEVAKIPDYRIDFNDSKTHYRLIERN